MNYKKILAGILGLTICAFAFAGCGQETGNTEQKDDTNDTAAVYQQDELREFTEDELLSGKHHVEMEIEDLGVIKLELDADQAPISVTSFIELAKDGFYDGLTFHRIFPDSFMQGGDPLGNGTGGPGYRIKGEFTANGVDNTLSHTRGAVSMARTSDMDGGGCQFFIMDNDYTAFDGQYAVFGYVTDGMEIVDQICSETPITDNNGSVDADDQPVMKKVTVID